MKKLLSLIFALSLAICIMPAAFAASNEATQAADALYELGLFKGTGTNADGTPIYDLDKTPTRNQAIIMLVRLLGKEDEALAGTWNIPFTDVADNMKPYIGYAYTNGLTNGYTATTYCGTNPIKANQYIAFVLRALGYESGKDFEVGTSYTLSDALGITNGEYSAASTFTRGNVAIISNNALAANLKGQAKILKETLNLESKEQEKEQPEEKPEQTFTLDGVWLYKPVYGYKELIISGNTFTLAGEAGMMDEKYYESGTFTLENNTLTFFGKYEEVEDSVYSVQNRQYSKELTIVNENQILFKKDVYNRQPSAVYTDQIRTTVTGKASGSSGSSASNGVPCYSRFPDVPDFGAIAGVKYDYYQPSFNTVGYYYDYAKIKASPHADDFASLYGEALAKCGFKHTRTDPGDFPTTWFHNAKGTAVAIAAAADTKEIKFYYQIFIIPA